MLAFILFIGLSGAARGADSQTSPQASPNQSTLDMVTLKDGSVIYGHVLGMVAGELHIKTAFGVGDEVVRVMWPLVAGIVVHRPVPFNLKEGTVIAVNNEHPSHSHLVIHPAT